MSGEVFLTRSPVQARLHGHATGLVAKMVGYVRLRVLAVADGRVLLECDGTQYWAEPNTDVNITFDIKVTP